MKYEIYPGELSHHGVKGMKWGIRKQRRAMKRDYKRSLKQAKKASLAKYQAQQNRIGNATKWEQRERDAWTTANRKARLVDQKTALKTKKLEKRNKSYAYQTGKDAVRSLLYGTLASAAVLDVMTNGAAHKAATTAGKKAAYNVLSKVRDYAVSERAAKSAIKIAGPVAAKATRIAKGVYYTKR